MYRTKKKHGKLKEIKINGHRNTGLSEIKADFSIEMLCDRGAWLVLYKSWNIIDVILAKLSVIILKEKVPI